jgi:hypothetical protein
VAEDLLVSDHSHPVYEAYDLLRRAALNRAYYSKRLSSAKKRYRWYEICLAIMAPSSGIAGLSIIDTEVGRAIWGLTTLAASLLAIAKPFLRMSDRVESYESAATSYRSLEWELSELRAEIVQAGVFDERMKEWLRHIRRRIGRVAETEPIEDPDEDFINFLYGKINAQYPANSLFVPEEKEK